MQTLIRDLTDAELARLYMKFEIPLTISRMVNDEEIFDDEASYALHERFDTMSPGKALIAIAMCAQTIVGHCGHMGSDGAMTKMLGLVAHQQIEDNGRYWLQSNPQHAIDDQHTIDDLESLRDLLFAACHEMEDETLVALYVFLANEADVHADETHPHEHDFTCHHDDDMAITHRDNVVAFPGRHKADQHA